MSGLSEEKVRSAVTLDSENAALIVETEDFSFTGYQVTLTIKVGSKSIIVDSQKSLLISLEFEADLPQFDLEEQSESITLTCSLVDATWMLNLPDVKDEDIQDIQIKMLTETKYFTFLADTRAVFLIDSI